MSASPTTPGQPNLSAIVSTYRVPELKAFIKELNTRFGERMSVTGNKPHLVARVNGFINTRSSAEVVRIREAMIAASLPSGFGLPEKHLASGAALKHTALKEWLRFRSDPFVTVKELVHMPVICNETYSAHQCVHFAFSLTPDQVATLSSSQHLLRGSSYQIYFFATAVHGHIDLVPPPPDGSLVEFPNKCDIRVNGTQIDALRLKGLKNKPGTANPVNITSLCNLTAGKTNRLDFAYTETSKKFIGVVYICEERPVDVLINQLKRNQRIAKATVAAAFKKGEEDDLMMTQSTLSLRDPAALTRIVVPARSKNCDHVQCFDARTFLELNKQIPTWKCPLCSSPVVWDDVRIDEFFLDILNSVNSDVDSVVLDPDGKWRLTSEDASRAAARAPQAATVVSLDSSDEETHPTPREASTAARSLKRARTENSDSTPVLPVKKRMHVFFQQPQVIDLTSDSDSEDVIGVPAPGSPQLTRSLPPAKTLQFPRLYGTSAAEPNRLQPAPLTESNRLQRASAPEAGHLQSVPVAVSEPYRLQSTAVPHFMATAVPERKSLQPAPFPEPTHSHPASLPEPSRLRAGPILELNVLQPPSSPAAPILQQDHTPATFSAPGTPLNVVDTHMWQSPLATCPYPPNPRANCDSASSNGSRL